MSRTRVQQTQISGSLSSDILDNLAAGSELAAQSTLVGDLNAMRSQLNKIIGVGNWYDELAGTQDLADIQGAMHVTGGDAAFQGDVSAVGDLSAVDGTFSGNLSAIGGDFTVQAGVVAPLENGYLTYNTQTNFGVDIDLKPSNGDRTGVFLAGTNIFAVDYSSSPPQIDYRAVVSSTYNGSFTRVTVSTPVAADLIGVVGNPAPPGAAITLNVPSSPALLSMNGDVTANDGTFNGDLTAVDATLSGDLSAVGGTFSGNISAVDATLSGDLAAVSGSFSGNVSISGDVAQRLYIVGAAGEIKDEEALTFDGSTLGVTGAASISGDLTALGGQFAVQMVEVNPGEFAYLTYLPGVTTAGNINAVDINAANAVFLGSGSFGGDLSAVDATLSGDLAAVDATLSGNISAVDGTFSGDLSAVGGTFSGNISAVDATLSGDLAAVSGSFDALAIAGDVAQRLYIVGANGEIKDEAKLTFDGSELAIDGDLSASGDLSAIGGDFSVAAGLAGTPEGGYLGYAAYGEAWSVTILGSNVAGLFPDGTPVAIYNSSDWTIPPHYTTVYSANGQPAGGAYNAGGAYTVMTLNAGMGALAYNAVVALVGNSAPSGAAVLINTSSPAVLSMTGSIKISGDVAQRLYIVGADGEIKDESKLTFDGSELAIDGDLAAADGHFTGNVQVDGDLRVKGSMTYIDTQNMRVQDAFIYLATGSVGTTDSGIVLHGGAGANMDLVIGQDGGAGEVIFGKGNRYPDGDGSMNGISLVPAWMSEIKLGGVEGSLSGSFSIEGNNMKLEAANDLSLAANGESVGLMSAADYTLFDSNFSATSIVGALNELYAAGAGGAAKGNLALSDVTVDVLDFSAVGTLSSADHKFIDVYLNGVLLAPGIDVTAVAVDNVTLAAGVVSELTVDDVFTVVLRGAAAS